MLRKHFICCDAKKFHDAKRHYLENCLKWHRMRKNVINHVEKLIDVASTT